jgi:hypothetical protein
MTKYEKIWMKHFYKLKLKVVVNLQWKEGDYLHRLEQKLKDLIRDSYENK